MHSPPSASCWDGTPEDGPFVKTPKQSPSSADSPASSSFDQSLPSPPSGRRLTLPPGEVMPSSNFSLMLFRREFESLRKKLPGPDASKEDYVEFTSRLMTMCSALCSDTERRNSQSAQPQVGLVIQPTPPSDSFNAPRRLSTQPDSLEPKSAGSAAEGSLRISDNGVSDESRSASSPDLLRQTQSPALFPAMREEAEDEFPIAIPKRDEETSSPTHGAESSVADESIHRSNAGSPLLKHSVIGSTRSLLHFIEQESSDPNFYDSNNASLISSSAAARDATHSRAIRAFKLPTSIQGSPNDEGLRRTASGSSAGYSSRCLSGPTLSTASLQSLRHVVVERQGTVVVEADGKSMLCEYEIIAEIGQGSFGTVVLAVPCGTDSEEPVAIKTMYRKKINRHNTSESMSTHDSSASEMEPNAHNAVEREIALMKRLRHKNLVRLFTVIEDEVQQQVHLVMQYIENGPIAELSRQGTCTPLPVDDVVHYMVQVSSGLDYLHKRGILHRDVKPENILIGRDRVAYVADFGVSTVITDGAKGVAVTAGTIPFFSPELCSEPDAVEKFGKECDVWAFGVTLYVLLYGKLPFTGWNQPSLVRSIMNDPLQLPETNAVGTAIPALLRQMLANLLQKSPRQRISLKAFRAQMRRCGLAATTEGSVHKSSPFDPPNNVASNADHLQDLFSDEEEPKDEAIVIGPEDVRDSVLRRVVSFSHGLQRGSPSVRFVAHHSVVSPRAQSPRLTPPLHPESRQGASNSSGTLVDAWHTNSRFVQKLRERTRHPTTS